MTNRSGTSGVATSAASVNWWGPARVPFLLLTLACVGLGAAVAWVEGPVSEAFVREALLALLGGLGAHVGVNALNEYLDFKSGLDQLTVKTPFSGGSGTLPARPEWARHALAMGVAGILVCVGVGGYFLAVRPESALVLVPIGVAGLALVGGYTPWITRSPWLCLLAPGLGFGPLMVVGTQVALTGHATGLGWAMSWVPFWLINNLLLLNQFPDVTADRQVGRRTLPMVRGYAFAVEVMGWQWAMAFGGLVAMVAAGWLMWPVLLGAMTAPLALWVWWELSRAVQGRPTPQGGIGQGMALNVVVAVITPGLLSAGVVLGAAVKSAGLLGGVTYAGIHFG